MKKLTPLLSFVLLIVIFNSCKKNDSTEEIPVNAQATFYLPGSFSDTVSVTIKGTTKKITTAFGSSAPTSCGTAGCATFDLSFGTYNVSATDGITTWSGSFSISSNQCLKINITNFTASTASAGGSMEGSYSGSAIYLPGQIQIGASASCTNQSYQSLLDTNNSFLVVSKLTDDSVRFNFVSTGFTTITFDRHVTKAGNIVSFDGGSYNVLTRAINYSGNTPSSTWDTASACLQQLPYVYGTLDAGVYVYWTVDYLTYTGQK